MKTPLGMEVDLGPGDIVLKGDPAPPRERSTAAPLFSLDVCCGHGRPSQLLLSSCCTARRGQSLLLYSGPPVFTLKIAALHEGSGPLSNTWFLVPPEFTARTASSLVQQFLQASRLRQTDRPCYSICTRQNSVRGQEPLKMYM